MYTRVYVCVLTGAVLISIRHTNSEDSKLFDRLFSMNRLTLTHADERLPLDDQELPKSVVNLSQMIIYHRWTVSTGAGCTLKSLSFMDAI